MDLISLSPQTLHDLLGGPVLLAALEDLVAQELAVAHAGVLGHGVDHVRGVVVAEQVEVRGDGVVGLVRDRLVAAHVEELVVLEELLDAGLEGVLGQLGAGTRQGVVADLDATQGALDLVDRLHTQVARDGVHAVGVGPVRLAAALDGAHGMLYLHTSYGDISVENAYDTTLDLDARNGKVSFDGALSRKADHSVESTYADVLLRLPSDTAVYLDARTQYGDIHCDFDVLVTQEGGRAGGSSNEESLRGTINDGEVTLSIDTHNGSITIESTH